MARPKKTGLDYYPMDVDFMDDYRIIDLLSMYGPLGVSVYISMISEIYKHGYYLEVTKEMLAVQMIRLIGSRWIKSKDKVIKIIEYCAEIGLIDKELFEQSVITSKAVQKRYRAITARNRADKEKYWLLEKEAPVKQEENKISVPSSQNESASQTGVSDAETGVYAAETEVYDDFIPQSKVKESKVKERKENEKKINESKVCGEIVIPCRDGEFVVDDKLLDELAHTYPCMNVKKSLNKLCSYVRSNPKKQGYHKGVRPYIDLWLAEDDYSGKYRKSQYEHDYSIYETEPEDLFDPDELDYS